MVSWILINLPIQFFVECKLCVPYVQINARKRKVRPITRSVIRSRTHWVQQQTEVPKWLSWGLDTLDAGTWVWVVQYKIKCRMGTYCNRDDCQLSSSVYERTLHSELLAHLSTILLNITPPEQPMFPTNFHDSWLCWCTEKPITHWPTEVSWNPRFCHHS